MNGEMYQICCITAATKKALKMHTSINYIPSKYENRIEFQFLPKKGLFGAKHFRAKTVSSWYECCLEKGLEDIKFLTPMMVKDRSILGFSNTTQSSIVCFWNKKVTYFTAQWEFDSKNKLWNILYTEQIWDNAPAGKPHFENNTEEFKEVLMEIKEFAKTIDYENFSTIFQKALNILLGSTEYTDSLYQLALPEIPEEHLSLFEAASTADVFGAMGSWNDGPPYTAHVKGLDKEYENLSNALLLQTRRAILYAINEW